MDSSFYANFTNMTFQKIPSPHLTRMTYYETNFFTNADFSWFCMNWYVLTCLTRNFRLTRIFPRLPEIQSLCLYNSFHLSRPLQLSTSFLHYSLASTHDVDTYLSRCKLFGGFSPLVPSKWEKNILFLLSWFCSAWILYSVFTFQFLNHKIHNYVKKT